MKLETLHTPAIANAGVGLVTAGSSAIAADFVALTAGTALPLVALVAPFVGIALGVALAYLGAPMTLPPPATPPSTFGNSAETQPASAPTGAAKEPPNP